MAPSPLIRFLTAPALLLTVVMLWWGSNVVVARAVVGEIDPHSLNFWRWILAVVLLAPFAWGHVRRDWRLLRAHWPLLALLGLTGVSIFSATIYIAVHSTNAINALLVGSMTPVATVIASWLILRIGVSGRETLGFVIAFAGVLAVICQGDPAILATLEFRTGDLLMLIAISSWAVYAVFLKRVPSGLHPLSLLMAVMVAGVVFISPLFAWEISRGASLAVNLPGLLAILYGAVFVSVLGYILFNKACEAIGANRANLFSYLAPIFGALLAVIFLGEAFELYHLFGLVLIFVGIYLATRWTAARADEAPAVEPPG